MQKATSLYDIIQLKNNMQLTHETVNHYYVGPPGKVEAKIYRFFQLMHHHPQKMLLIGPKGAGKRSLVKYFVQQELNTFHCLTVDLLNRLNPIDISQVDIIFCLLSHLIKDLSCTQKRLDPGVLNSIYQNLHDEQLISLIHFKKSEAGDAEGTKIGFVLSFINAIVEAISTTGKEIRNQIRKSFEPRLRLILKSLQELIDYSHQLAQRNGRALVIIFDNLGQFEQTTAESFFQNHLSLSGRLNAHIIYTMPDYIRFSPFFPVICGQMDRVEYLRMTPTQNYDQLPYAPGTNYIRNIINKRIESKLIPEMIRERIIDVSGGVINDAFNLLIETAICTLTDNADSEMLQQDAYNQIETQLIRQKIQQLDYQAFCLMKDLDLSNPSWTGNKEIQHLMTLNILIEYESEQHVWFDIHPLIKEYIHNK